MSKFQKFSFRALIIIPALFSIFISGTPLAGALTECTAENQILTDTCVTGCMGDQLCIDECCSIHSECCTQETCAEEDQLFIDTCLDQCTPGDPACGDNCCANYPNCFCGVMPESCTDSDQKIMDTCVISCQGDQSCIDGCCLDYPDCDCPQTQDACTDSDQKIMDTCVISCQGDQSCIDNCCIDYPDCDCPAQPSCVDQLKICHGACTDVPCWLSCDEQYPECANCLSYVQCKESLCSPDDTNCLAECDKNYPECTQEQPPQDYDGCYQDCFSYYKDPLDILSCIDNCQGKYPGDFEKPYRLKEPRCFIETTFFDYEDVPSEVWFWAPINFLTRLEIPAGNGTGINSDSFHSRIVRGYNRDDEDDSRLKPGMTKDIFLPTRDLNRFEASKIATLISCYTIPDTTTDIIKGRTFSDLNPSSNEYMERVIYRTAEVNLIQGYTDGSFKPFQSITRAEFLKLFLTVGGFDVHNQTYASSGFSDVTDPNAWYYPYIAFASNNAIPIIGGYDNGTFRPNTPIARNEAMKIITNTMLALDWISTTGA